MGKLVTIFSHVMKRARNYDSNGVDFFWTMIKRVIYQCEFDFSQYFVIYVYTFNFIFRELLNKLFVKLILCKKLLGGNRRLRQEMYENIYRPSNLIGITTSHLFSLRTFSGLLNSMKRTDMLKPNLHLGTLELIENKIS